jgi:uncharacterized protein with von Willebrand factor type A (vWA) domain
MTDPPPRSPRPDLPDVPDLADVAARFATLLHAAGVPVTPERAGRFASVVALARPVTVSELYWPARVTLVVEHSHIPVFDRVFAQVFEGLADLADFRGDTPPPPESGRRETRPSPALPPARHGSLALPGAATGESVGDGDGDGPEHESLTVTSSSDERLRHQDFATLTPEELARVRDLAKRMSLVPPSRRSRRKVRNARGTDLDVRATLRRARRTGGEPMYAVRRRPRRKPRRVVLMCDISGSMEAYARAYLQLLVSGVDGVRAEAFVFATRLTRLTGTLRGADPDAGLRRAGRLAPDWSGGTRIGDAMKSFTDGYGRRGLARGAVILVLSDGWDTGDPELLAREMARLRRLAFRIVWVNPRKVAPGYEPLAGGMAAALPYVDAFVSGHSLVALDQVLEAIASPEHDRSARPVNGGQRIGRAGGHSQR